jgi:hypothetical protein
MQEDWMTFSVRSRSAAALALAALLAACNDDTAPATPTPSPTPTPTPAPQVLSYQPLWELGSQFYISEQFVIPGPGEITARADWESGSNNVDVFVTSAPCSARQFFGNDKKCRIYDKDETDGNKPAVATFRAGSTHVGSAKIWVLNHGPSAEKGHFIVERQPTE